MRILAGIPLLLIGVSGLACHPPAEDFGQRRLQLEQEFAVIGGALDDVEARLALNRQRMSAWDERLATRRIRTTTVLAPSKVASLVSSTQSPARGDEGRSMDRSARAPPP